MPGAATPTRWPPRWPPAGRPRPASRRPVAGGPGHPAPPPQEGEGHAALDSAAMTPDPAWLASHLRDVPDFPEPGIVFKDVTPLLADAAAFRATVDAVADHATA